MKHYSISVYPYEWEKLKELATAQKKERSSYISEKVFNFIKEHKFEAPADINRYKDDKDSVVHSLTCNDDLFELIKKAVDVNDMKLTRYIINIALAGVF